MNLHVPAPDVLLVGQVVLMEQVVLQELEELLIKLYNQIF